MAALRGTRAARRQPQTTAAGQARNHAPTPQAMTDRMTRHETQTQPDLPHRTKGATDPTETSDAVVHDEPQCGGP